MGDEAVSPHSSPKRIFLSYGHDEFSPLAERLKNDLIAVGHQVWLDTESIPGGADWEHSIERGLDWVSEYPEIGRFVLVMTPHSVRRPDGFCLNELAMAINRHVHIIPIMVSLCEPPLSICRLQWLDMMDCWPLPAREERYLQKLGQLLNSLKPDDAVIDYKESQSRLLHLLEPLPFDADISQHLSRFTGRHRIIERISAWLNDPLASRIFLLSGPPGIGKTTIASWLCYNLPEVAAFHLCQSGNIQKSDARKCILSIAYQLSTQLPDYRDRLNRLKLERSIGEYDARTLFDHIIVQPLSGNFPRPGHNVLVIIDGLDEAVQNDKNELADFIAFEFMKTPDWLRLFITTRPDPRVLHSLQELTPYMIDPSTGDNEADIREFISRELRPHFNGGEPSRPIVDTILAKSEGIFLYVEWIRRELEQGRLSIDAIGDFPQGLGGVYAQFFRRQFHDQKEYKANVRPVLELMLAAQEPMSIQLLSEMLGWDEYEQVEILELLSPLFMSSGEFIKPFHSSLTEWLTDPTRAGPYFISIREGHRILGQRWFKEYQAGRWSSYTISYLPLHLCLGKLNDELVAVLSDIRFIHAQWEKDQFSVMKEWTYIEEHTPIRMVDIYRHSIDNAGEKNEKDVMTIALILQWSFHFDDAYRLWDYLVGYYRKSGDNKGLIKSLCNQAVILYHKGDFAASMARLKEDEKICRNIGSREGLAVSLGYQAEILRSNSDYDGAMALLKEEEKIYRDLGDISGLQVNLGDQGQILRVRGALDDALILITEQERICRNSGNKNSLGYSLQNQGLILLMRGDLSGAMALFGEEERICREIGYKYGLQEALCGKGIVLMARGILPGAISLFTDAEKICIEIDNRYGIAVALGHKAKALERMGDLDGAMGFRLSEEHIYRDFKNQYGTAISLSGQAVILRMKGELDSAYKLHGEAEKIFRRIGYRYGLQDCLGNMALVLYAKGDPESALACLHEQESICRDMKLKPDLEKCLEAQKIVQNASKSQALKVPELSK